MWVTVVYRLSCRPVRVFWLCFSYLIRIFNACSGRGCRYKAQVEKLTMAKDSDKTVGEMKTLIANLNKHIQHLNQAVARLKKRAGLPVDDDILNGMPAPLLFVRLVSMHVTWIFQPCKPRGQRCLFI